MSDEPRYKLPNDKPADSEASFDSVVASKAARKLRVQREGTQSAWFGLGMSGLIGWSVAVPAVCGVLLGLWLDAKYPGRFSWTLALLFAGLFIGCLNAWHWVAQQDQAMHREDSEDDKDASGQEKDDA
ncbi:MAG: AtpZ/AtpI family protein [Nitrospirota bacterium]